MTTKTIIPVDPRALVEADADDATVGRKTMGMKFGRKTMGMKFGRKTMGMKFGRKTMGMKFGRKVA